MKYLITGLGNIGAEYADTRHNIGFKILDAVAEKTSGIFKTERYGDLCEVKYKGRSLLLLKPSTYMNLSGKAVNYWMQKEKIAPENLFVVVDDLALPFGAVRLRMKGSDGGHNGLKNINEILGHDHYPRLRFGIGDAFRKGGQIDYVLGKWTEEEQTALPERITWAVEAILSYTVIGMERTMNLYNKK